MTTDPTVAKLLRQLAAHTPELREAAQRELVARGTEVLLPLVELLTDKDREQRLGAVLTLGRLGDIRAIGPLLALSKQTDKKDLPLLLRAISDLTTPEATDALKVFLLRHLQHDDLFVRALACRGLGRIGDSTAQEALKLALRDKEVWVRDAAREALATSSSASPPSTALTTAGAALALRDAVPDADVAALHSLDPAVQKRASDALVARGESAVPAIRRKLASEDRSTRRAAIEVLGRIGGAEAIEALTQLLQDDDLEAQPRAAALYALGRGISQTPEERAFSQPLVEAHLEDPDVYVRAAAVVCLLQKGGEARRTALVALMEDDEEWVHVAGLRTFAKLATPADRLLRDTLVDGMGRVTDHGAQAHLLLALAKLLDPPLEEDQQIVGPTSFFLDHEQQTVRQAALLLILRSARQLDGPLLARIHEAMEQDPEAELWVARALERAAAPGREGALSLLVQLTRSVAQQVVGAAARALGTIGGLTAVDVLVGLANSSRSVAAIATEVLEGLDEAGEVTAQRDEAGRWQRHFQPRCSCGGTPDWVKSGEREELRCPTCSSEYVQASSGRLFAADRTPFGVCLCCTRKRPLVRGSEGQGLQCPETGEVHIRPHDAPRQILRASALPFGACRCCPDPQPLVPVGDRVVCRRTRRDHQPGPQGYELPSGPAVAMDINAINEALLGGSLDIGQSGVPLARRGDEDDH